MFCFNKEPEPDKVSGFYDQRYAEKNDHFAQKDSYIEELESALGHEPLTGGERVLDLCCNTGRTISYLNDKLKINAVGLDRNPVALEMAHQREPEVMFVRCEGPELPFAEGSFHRVVFNHALGHVPDAFGFVVECYRVLKPQGVLSIATPNYWYKLAMTIPNLFNTYQPDPTVLRTYSVSGLAQLLREVGFTQPLVYSFGEKTWAGSRSRVLAVAKK